MATVILPRSLVALFPGTDRHHQVDGSTVAEVIDHLDARIPGIRNRLVDAGPMLREHLNVFVAGERASLESAVPAEATIHIIPAVSGGSLPGQATLSWDCSRLGNARGPRPRSPPFGLAVLVPASNSRQRQRYGS